MVVHGHMHVHVELHTDLAMLRYSREWAGGRKSVCVCVRARARERACVCVCAERWREWEKESGREGECVYVCARARARDREKESMYDRESMYMVDMGWLRLVGSLKLQVSFAEYRLFYRALLQKRPIILMSLLIEATP